MKMWQYSKIISHYDLSSLILPDDVTAAACRRDPALICLRVPAKRLPEARQKSLSSRPCCASDGVLGSSVYVRQSGQDLE